MPKPLSPRAKPAAAEYGQLIASLARQTGEPQARWKGRLGASVNGRDRGQIVEAVIAAQREFPKGGE